MANVKIRGQSLNIDIETELSEFDWERPKWTSDKLIAVSPFRDDRTPSFFVRLDGEMAGAWSDSGAYDDEYRSGGIVKLLSYLRNETQEETVEYLFTKYGGTFDSRDFSLNLPKIKISNSKMPLERGTIVRHASPYLTKRGISLDVQAVANVGKSRHKYYVAIPWYTADKVLANIKYRATSGKAFFYEKGATPIRELVYGADLYVKSSDDLIVCEAEIDALSWRTAGYNAVAVGGVAFTKQQAEILRRLPFDRLLLAGDNDQAGQAFNNRIVCTIKERPMALIQLDSTYKDANEALVDSGVLKLQEAVANALDLPRMYVKLQI